MRALAIGLMLTPLACGLAARDQAETARAEQRAPAAVAGESAARSYFTDVPLLSHEGKTKRLYTDLIQGRVVIINSFFASCKGSCPVALGNLRRVQDWLGDRLGSQVSILSITVDPEADTTRRLGELARQLGVRDGWYLLTGKPGNVRTALGKLGQWVDNPESHTPIVIVGNEPTGLWKKAFGLAGADQLIRVVASVLGDAT